MHPFLVRLRLTPRDVIDNILAGFDAAGHTALSGPLVFDGNDLAKTGVALIFQEALDSWGDNVPNADVTALARALLADLQQRGLRAQHQIIQEDGRAFAARFVSDRES